MLVEVYVDVGITHLGSISSWKSALTSIGSVTWGRQILLYNVISPNEATSPVKGAAGYVATNGIHPILPCKTYWKLTTLTLYAVKKEEMLI